MHGTYQARLEGWKVGVTPSSNKAVVLSTSFDTTSNSPRFIPIESDFNP